MPDFDIDSALENCSAVPPDFACPDGLSPKGAEAWEAIVTLLREKDDLKSGGHTNVFYSPAAWLDRGEDYGRGSELIILHDGGNHACYFNGDYECYSAVEAMRQALEQHGLYTEPCTSWYSAVYKI